MSELEPGESSRRGRQGAPRWVAAGLLVLLVVVALSVRAQYSRGPSAAAHGSASGAVGTVLQVLLLVGLAALELVIVLGLLYAPWRRLTQAGKNEGRRPVLTRMQTLRLVALPVAFLVAEAIFFFILVGKRRSSLAGHAGQPVLHLPKHPLVPTVSSVSLASATEVALVLGVVVVLAVLGYRLWRGPSAGALAEPAELPRELTSALDVSLAELEAGGDPRLAVIAAYERMEQVLARVGVPRSAFETPREYLDR
ncbi:MAG TPA: DUF4129 domain-containing protein, partial [Candidatus Dormibacteraeota bacterium]